MNIIFSSTTQLAAAIQAKQVSVLEAHLAQIEQYNSALNAIAALSSFFAELQKPSGNNDLNGFYKSCSNLTSLYMVLIIAD